jgi:hypothetical protein
MQVEGIYERWVPIPDARGDVTAFEFMEEVKAHLTVAISDVQKAVEEATSTDIVQATSAVRLLR